MDQAPVLMVIEHLGSGPVYLDNETSFLIIHPLLVHFSPFYRTGLPRANSCRYFRGICEFWLVFPSVPSALLVPAGLQPRASWACVSSCRVMASVHCQRLRSKKVDIGPYNPLRIGNSQMVPAVVTRHL